MPQATDIAKIVPEINHIQRISPEQLLVLFEACKHLDTTIPAWWYNPSSHNSRRACPTMIAISQVCRSWRALTHSTSSLWSEVLLDNVKWTKHFIKRSGKSYLNLFFHPCFGEEVSQIPKWKVERVDSLEAAICALSAHQRVRELNLICGPTSRAFLGALYAYGIRSARRVTQSDYMYIDEAMRPPMSQSLRALNISGFDVIGFHSPLTEAPLTSLSFSNAWEAKTNLSNVYPPPTMLVRPLLKLLAEIPTLQTLELSYPIYCPKISDDDLTTDDGSVISESEPHGWTTIYSSCRDAVKVPLPNLRSLTIHDEPSMLLSFYESLILPPLLTLVLRSEARAEDDEYEHTNLSAAEIASYDSRLAALLQSRCGATSSLDARYTRFELSRYGKAGTTDCAVTVELSHPGFSEILQLSMDRGLSENFASNSETLLRLLPILPSLDDIDALDVRVDLDEQEWRAISQWLRMVTHLVVHTNFALESLLRADEASNFVLFVHLENITLDGLHIQEGRDLLAYLRVRSDKGGRDFQWRRVNVPSHQVDGDAEGSATWGGSSSHRTASFKVA